MPTDDITQAEQINQAWAQVHRIYHRDDRPTPDRYLPAMRGIWEKSHPDCPFCHSTERASKLEALLTDVLAVLPPELARRVEARMPAINPDPVPVAEPEGER